MAVYRPSGHTPVKTDSNALYGGCGRLPDNSKCVNSVADEHVGVLRAANQTRDFAANQTRDFILELGGLKIEVVIARSALGHITVPDATDECRSRQESGGRGSRAKKPRQGSV